MLRGVKVVLAHGRSFYPPLSFCRRHREKRWIPKQRLVYCVKCFLFPWNHKRLKNFFERQQNWFIPSCVIHLVAMVTMRAATLQQSGPLWSRLREDICSSVFLLQHFLCFSRHQIVFKCTVSSFYCFFNTLFVSLYSICRCALMSPITFCCCKGLISLRGSLRFHLISSNERCRRGPLMVLRRWWSRCSSTVR